MIEVKVNKYKNKIINLKVTGHAEGGPYGHDLICAGVSAIITGGFNNLQNVNNEMIVLKNGYAHLKGEFNDHDQIVFETIIIQLETVQDSYPKNIRVEISCID